MASERLQQNPEQTAEKLDLSAEISKNLERAHKEAKESSQEQTDTSELTAKVEQQAVSSKEITIGEKQEDTMQEFGAYSELKTQAYNRTLDRIRQRLSAPEKVMSKTMHHKVVDAVSSGVAQTAARPSGILGGGIAALIGSSVLLYMAKHYGFRYNFLVVFVLLGGGFAAGIAIELLIRVIAKAKH